MKRVLLGVVILLLAAAGVPAQGTAISTGIGFSTFNYAELYLATHASFHITLARGMELNFGFDFALWPVRGPVPSPRFYLPIYGGVDFFFGNSNPIFFVGVGINPVFIIQPDPDPAYDEAGLRFFMGPSLRGGIRLRVHEFMSWFVYLQQDLLIGAPGWINTATGIKTGVNFQLSSPPRTRPPGAS
jgi:hypothetical protein